ncbi:hypothetical protein [Clostridium beijerinckii]|uniref:hypothetical protein n=1 Tax=Clostridium beijerinckii TaxID=1520 RepID=UPI001F19FE5B|nr:hypothetical protein [Clostridium beijerinckii]
MQLSSNYGLKLFEGTDNVKRQDFVDNFTKIDSVMKEHDTHLSDMVQDSYPTVIATGTNSYVGSTDKIKALGKGTTKLTLFVGADATGNCSLNLNSYGAKNIKDSFGNIVNNFKKDIPYNLCYNGTDFILQGKGGGGDATANQILNGKKVTVDSGQIVGTMPDRGNITATLNAGQSYTILEGHHSGGGKVTANSLASQTSATATAAQIVSGYSAWVDGNKVDGTASVQSLGGKKFDKGTTGEIWNSSQTVTLSEEPIIVFGVYGRDSTTFPFVYAKNTDLDIPTSGIFINYLSVSISGNTIKFSSNGHIWYVTWVVLYK